MHDIFRNIHFIERLTKKQFLARDFYIDLYIGQLLRIAKNAISSL